MAILKLLWEHGPSSVRDVHRMMRQEESVGKELAYNTVQTMLRIMEEKGLVSHHVEGRTFVYTARYSREQSARSFLERVFDGAASQLMVSLLRSETISEEELDELQALIRQARKARQTLEEQR
jgi:predicted transcriptional regulator